MMSDYRVIVAGDGDDPPEGYVEVRDLEQRRLFVEAALFPTPMLTYRGRPEVAELDAARRVAAGAWFGNADTPEGDSADVAAAVELLSAWEPVGVVGRYAAEDEPVPAGYVEACVRPPSGRRVFLLRAAVPPYLATGVTSLIELGDGIALARGGWPRHYRELLTGLGTGDDMPRLIDAGEIGDGDTVRAAAAATGGTVIADDPAPRRAPYSPGTPEFDRLFEVNALKPDAQIAMAASTLASIMAIGPDDAASIERGLERLGIRTDTTSALALKARAQRHELGSVTIDADEYARLVTAAIDVEGTRRHNEALIRALALADPVTVDAAADPTDPERTSAPGAALSDEQRRAWRADSGIDVERRRVWLEELMAEADAGHGDLGPFLTEIVRSAVQWRDERDAARTVLALLSNPLGMPLPPTDWQNHPWAVDMTGTLNRTRDALVNTSRELARLSGVGDDPGGAFTMPEPHPMTLVEQASAAGPATPPMLASPFPVFFGGQNGNKRVAVNVAWVELLLAAIAGATNHTASVYRERNAWAALYGADANAAAAAVGSEPAAVVAEDADPSSPGYAMFYTTAQSGPEGALEQVSLHYNVANDGDQFAGFPRVPGNPHDGHGKTEISARLARATVHLLAEAARRGRSSV